MPCFLEGFGPCSGKMSREHYISATVLEALSAGGAMKIGGLPWQPENQFQGIGIQSLQSKILCKHHNSSLSSLDSTAGRFFRTLNAIDKNPTSLQDLSVFDGPTVERWFLKILCGLAAGPGMNDGNVPAMWKQILVGSAWPDHWGLYLPMPTGPQTLATDLLIETFVHPQTKAVLASSFRVAGVSFNLLFGKPDNAGEFGLYRPRGLIFRNGHNEKCVELVWPHNPDTAVTYTKVGTSVECPPHHAGWEE